MTYDLSEYGLLGKALKKKNYLESVEKVWAVLKEATASVVSREMLPSLFLHWLGPGEGLPRLDL